MHIATCHPATRLMWKENAPRFANRHESLMMACSALKRYAANEAQNKGRPELSDFPFPLPTIRPDGRESHGSSHGFCDRECDDPPLGVDGADLWIQRHLAVDHQHEHHHRNLSHGVFD